MGQVLDVSPARRRAEQLAEALGAARGRTLRLVSRRPARLAAFTLLAGLAGACAPARETAQPAADELRTRVPAAWRFPLSAPAAFGEHGMVATDAALATRVGIEVLRAGGNAVDAAVATAFALAVVLPDAGNIGGGGFIVLHTQDGTEAALDFREAAPLAAHRDMYLDENGEVVPERSRTGHRAAGVPGAVAGLYEAHRRFGSRPWAELLVPAIRLADDGFPADSVFVAGIRADSQRLARFPASAALFLSRGRPPEPGSVWRNPDLAAALRRIAQHGPPGFYSGETAELIVAEMRRGGGLITHEDLARYRARWREPVVYHYRGHRVLSMPPPSSGGLTAALVANIVVGYDLHALGWHSPEALHLIAEAMRRGFADRNQFLGDPDFAPIPPTFL
ncbi:MAG: gamma-glutamyltransferase, partial [Gemmatimonadetes bacterium]|nr:gamma-glutamyltransferase [Gemmatimonadota bacterium]